MNESKDNIENARVFYRKLVDHNIHNESLFHVLIADFLEPIIINLDQT